MGQAVHRSRIRTNVLIEVDGSAKALDAIYESVPADGESARVQSRVEWRLLAVQNTEFAVPAFEFLGHTGIFPR